MSQYAKYPSNTGGGGGGVTSLNSLTGAITLLAGPNITITPSGNVLTIASTGGGGSGTVTSVGLAAPSSILSVSGSPVTTSGTLALALATQTANFVWAGPTTGSAATPTFRALVAADLPSGTGTVTSVALTAPSSILSVSGSPITTSGTLALALTTQTANTVWAGPTTGAAAAPTFRTLVAADIPSLSGIYLPLAGGTMTGAITGISGSATATSYNFGTAGTGFYGSSTLIEAAVAGSISLSLGANIVKLFDDTSSTKSLIFDNTNLNSVYIYTSNGAENGDIVIQTNAAGGVGQDWLLLSAGDGGAPYYPFQYSCSSANGGSFTSYSQLKPLNSVNISNLPAMAIINNSSTVNTMAGYFTTGSSHNPMCFIGSKHLTQTSGAEVSSVLIATQRSGTLTTAMTIDTNGNTSITGAIFSATAQTTLTGSAGTAVCSEPDQGSSHKKVVIYLNGYTDTGTQTYTFPTAFLHTPYVYGLSAGVTGTTATTTTVTFTVTAQTGFVFLEGY